MTAVGMSHKARRPRGPLVKFCPRLPVFCKLCMMKANLPCRPLTCRLYAPAVKMPSQNTRVNALYRFEPPKFHPSSLPFTLGPLLCTPSSVHPNPPGPLHSPGPVLHLGVQKKRHLSLLTSCTQASRLPGPTWPTHRTSCPLLMFPNALAPAPWLLALPCACTPASLFGTNLSSYPTMLPAVG